MFICRPLNLSLPLKQLAHNEPIFIKNLLSYCFWISDCSDLQSPESESLNNLSEAIVARQQLELSMNSTSPRNVDFEFLEDFRAPDADLLDQVIDLDNTVTKLLKVITIVQTNGKEQLLNQERYINDILK